jgi:hypothetical protein
MSIFGPGVGGGFLAAAGAAKGLGEGIAEGGEMGVKQQMMEKQNQMQLDREKTIQELQQKFQSQQTEKELAGHSAVAHFTQEQENLRAGQERTSKEKVAGEHETAATERAGIMASSRIGAAAIRDSSNGSKGEKPDFTISHIQVAPRDPTGKPIIGAAPETHLVAVHKSGQQYMQVGGSVDPASGMPVGGKMVLFDSQRNQPVDLSARPRPNAGAVSDLIQNPNADHAMAFQQRYGYLPSEYFGAAHAQAQSKQQSSQSISARFPVFNYFGKGAQVTHSIPVGGSPGGDQGTGSGPSGGASGGDSESNEQDDTSAVEGGPTQ